ncbi:hypothetical protein [Compostimonas suwonensis]|uniref:hypothetical protein n=1 Tax=Compostimonas suwonensis TaxID=1048394 RepID=UPI0012FE4E64|nr:hypothetical protein [Compostimonas suwonensis]
MRAELTTPVIDIDAIPAVYRVRLWAAPSRAGFAWSIDDWELRDVTDVDDVLAWGAERAGDQPFEVFVRCADRGVFVRIHGRPADEGTQVTVVLTADG